MAHDEEVKIVVNFDTADAIKHVLNLKNEVAEVGEAKSLEHLISGIGELGKSAGFVAAAFFAVKTGIELVQEAEHIKQINYQFEVMAENAGIAADVLKNKLVKAADGLADDTDMMLAASKAMAQMEGGAENLGNTMELARKVTRAFGGDLIDNFEKINTAIATGSTRQLRHMNIIVDADSAIKKYAKSHQLLADELTQAGKQAAISDAVMAAGAKATAGVKEDITASSTAITQMKVVLKDLGEVAVLAWDRIAGDYVRERMQSYAGWTATFKRFVVSNIGEPNEKAAAMSERLQEKIMGLKGSIAELESAKSQKKNLFDQTYFIADIAAAKRELKSLTDQLDALKKKSGEGGGAGHGEEVGKPKEVPSVADAAKVAENKAKSNEALIAIEMQMVHDREKIANDFVTYSSVKEEEIALIKRKAAVDEQKIYAEIGQGKIRDDETTQARIKEIRLSAAVEEERIDEEVDAKRRAGETQAVDARLKSIEAQIGQETDLKNLKALSIAETLALEEQLALTLDEIENKKGLTVVQQEELKRAAIAETAARQSQAVQSSTERQITALDNTVKKGASASASFAAGWQISALQAGTASKNLAKVGGVAFDSLSNNATDAFMNMAHGGKFAADAMLKATLNSVGKESIARGNMMLLASVFPPNPAGLAAGAGLIALGTGLAALGGGSGAGAASASGGGGEGGGPREASSDFGGSGRVESQGEQVKQMEKQQRVVNVQIAGNFFETDQTRRQLMEMIRSETDATDFRYARIGE